MQPCLVCLICQPVQAIRAASKACRWCDHVTNACNALLLCHIACSDIGGCKEQIEKMREVVELPMLHPEKFVQLGIDPPKGVLCYGPPGWCLGSVSPAVVSLYSQCFSTQHSSGWLLIPCVRGTALFIPWHVRVQHCGPLAAAMNATRLPPNYCSKLQSEQTSLL